MSDGSALSNGAESEARLPVEIARRICEAGAERAGDPACRTSLEFDRSGFVDSIQYRFLGRKERPGRRY